MMKRSGVFSEGLPGWGDDDDDDDDDDEELSAEASP
jgi:hypothetical protein